MFPISVQINLVERFEVACQTFCLVLLTFTLSQNIVFSILHLQHVKFKKKIVVNTFRGEELIVW